ncbi:MAG: hypothetical protein WBB28_23775 [Crinalium sp.]
MSKAKWYQRFKRQDRHPNSQSGLFLFYLSYPHLLASHDLFFHQAFSFLSRELPTATSKSLNRVADIGAN